MNGPSPLTRQIQPDVFKPKVVDLYESLFLHLDDTSDPDSAAAVAARPPGFWRELFLLPPDRAALRSLLGRVSAGALLRHAEVVQMVVLECLDVMRGAAAAAGAAGSGSSGSGAVSPTAARRGVDVARRHAVDTLGVVLAGVLGKKYAHASSDMITVLAGLDEVDAVFTEMVGVLEGMVRGGEAERKRLTEATEAEVEMEMEQRTAAVQVLLAFAAGAYGTTLPTYLMQRDLFPAIMKIIHDAPNRALPPFILLGLLANYNKFEFQNPYSLRLADFVNELSMQRLVTCIGRTCADLRAAYIAVQDDAADSWSLAGALGRLVPGWGREKKQRPVYDEDTARSMFAQLPGPAAAVLLATYDFAHANKMFCMNLVAASFGSGPGGPGSPGGSPEQPNTQDPNPSHPSEPPFASYLSLSSYLLQHAYLSPRASYYAHLSLMVMRLLVEDPAICKRLCSSDASISVRLCRQRPPHMPVTRGPRVPAAHLLDAMADGLAHNLRRRRLDVALYTQMVGIVLRLLSYLSRTRTRVASQWAELFRGLLSLLRFAAQYAADLAALPGMARLVALTGNVLALALSAGEAFLPSPAAYDDLFYKVVESGDALERVHATYGETGQTESVDTLLGVSAHYKRLLTESGAGAEALTALQVAETIKQGYETLSIQAREGLDMWDRYREADERVLLKKAARTAVGDALVLVDEF
ncbi:hypothetical protein TD95_000506 [Thielaviopsis punctulata]|uniref:Armadillo-like helical domain-containing protein n=1 Tax=Thielaviopsis punctulata TaxID=72032 RepID=A0A0F4Z9L6_9PEZI|nr:hypothetical protein TD95_000506 [Thielaviopsis punctulata]